MVQVLLFIRELERNIFVREFCRRKSYVGIDNQTACVRNNMQ
jgi:hypothetical protein